MTRLNSHLSCGVIDWGAFLYIAVTVLLGPPGAHSEAHGQSAQA